MIWAKEETLPRAEIEKIQLEKLKQTVHYIYERVEPYRRKMEDAGVKPEDIQSLDDLKKLPFTYKADFRDNYPMGLFAVDKKDLVRFHASSGTTGKPTVVGYTRKDPGCVAWKCGPHRLHGRPLRQDDVARSPLATHIYRSPGGSTEDWNFWGRL